MTYSPDDDTLVLHVALHVVVGIISDGEDVWRLFSYFPITVIFDLLGCVDGQNLVRVHCHQDGTRVRLREARASISTTDKFIQFH